jgi:hypothetical protein
MRTILARDWQKVLIRARLFPCEVHEFTVVEVPLFVSREIGRSSEIEKSGWVRYCRVKVLPVHAACSLRPPPEVVRALLSHAVGSAFSSKDGMHSDVINRNLFGKTRHQRELLHEELSSPVPLHHEHNTSLATVAVQRMEGSSIGRAIVDKLTMLGGMARKASFRERRDGKPPLLCSSTQGEDCDTKDDDSRYQDDGTDDDSEVVDQGTGLRESAYRRENEKDVALFLKQMEDHLANNGRSQSVFRDANTSSESSDSSHHRRSPRSLFVLDFDPSVLLPSPSAVRMAEKQSRALHSVDRDDGLYSLENSIGDSETDAMTTSTPQLVGNNNTNSGKDGENSEESSSLEYLSDESSSDPSSDSSSLMSPPCSDSDDSGESSDDSNSFLQLTADGRLAMVDVQDNSDSTNTDQMSDAPDSTSGSESSATDSSGTTSSDSRPSIESSSDSRLTNCLPMFVPEDIRLEPDVLLRSLPRVLGGVRGKGKSKASGNQGLEMSGLSRLLPLHIACLYGASDSVLKVLLDEYPEGSTIEVLGMLPVHMVAANWSLASTDASPGRSDDYDNPLTKGFDSEKDKLATLMEKSPKSLRVNSSAHGLRPLEYTRILLCYPANAYNEGMLRARDYLNSEEKRHDLRFEGREPRKHEHFQSAVEDPKKDAEDLYSKESCSNENEEDAYCNHQPIESTSTCTTSGLSSSWIANDCSSLHSSLESHSPKGSQVSLGDLMDQSRWEEAIALLQTNPEMAEEWCCISSFSDTTSEIGHSSYDRCIDGSASSEQKGLLPIHIACQTFQKGSSVPIQLVQLLISSHPEGLVQTDDRDGSLPLHLICDSFRRPSGLSIGSDRHRFVVSEKLRVLRLLLKEHPSATSVADHYGRLPLHRAILVRAPLEAIRSLMHRDPKAIALPDRNGKTPLCHARAVYNDESPVMYLLQRAWI